MKSCHDHLWYAWIYVLGSLETANKYLCEVKLSSLSEDGESVTFKGKPQSLDKSGQQVILSSGALMMSDAMMKKMFFHVFSVNNNFQFNGSQSNGFGLFGCNQRLIKRVNFLPRCLRLVHLFKSIL